MSNNIEKDIKILESLIEEYKNCSVEEIDMQVNVTFRKKQAEAISNILNKYKKNQNIVDEIKTSKERLKKEYNKCLETNSTKAFIIKCQLEFAEEILKED